MKAYERFLKYVRISSASSEEEGAATPSTKQQFAMADYLYAEMKSLGLENVTEDDFAYVCGYVPASEGCGDLPCIGLIAHIDTAPDFSGENVNPQIIPGYDGGDVALGQSGRVLSVAQFPHLASLKGQTLICTDGTTLLGADDKAGVAEILTAAEQLLQHPEIKHGRIAICFVPDEEIGHGAALLDTGKFGADFAYTVDGGEVNEINYETFNACAAKWEINGFNIHPGDAKNAMINASLVAMEINSMLPSGDVPSKTENYEGFFHLLSMEGNVEKAKLYYIVRDHDGDLFEGRKKTLKHIEKLINEKYGSGTAVLSIEDQYCNMEKYISTKPEVVERAKNAVRKVGLEPVTVPVRGGTDGAQLSCRGLLCPNLGTGGFAFHGPYEHITAERMDTVTQIIIGIVS